MNIMTAKRIGAESFMKGIPRAPACNAEFTKNICAASGKNTKMLISLMDAYMNGWVIAQLGHNQTDDFPSTKMFKIIMES